jgi:hypothetical protein
MDIVNDTNQDAKVRVAGGGSGIGPDEPLARDEDTSGWPVVPSGGQLKHKALASGPWTVCFAVNGRRIIEDVPPRARRVTLTRTFQVKVD